MFLDPKNLTQKLFSDKESIILPAYFFRLTINFTDQVFLGPKIQRKFCLSRKQNPFGPNFLGNILGP